MLQAWGWGTSPRTLFSNRTGATHVRFGMPRNALVAPSASAGALLRESAPSSTGRAQSDIVQPSAPEKPSAGRITPLKLARLSEVLQLPVTRVETILQRSPAIVRNMEPEDVAQRLQELCSGLCIPPKQAAFMVSKQPAYMLLTPLLEIRAKVQELSSVLGVPPAAVRRTALTVPSVLRRSTQFTERRVKAYCTLLRCTPLDMLHVMARGPEYLSDTPSSVHQRMTSLGYILRRPRCTIAAMLQARPDLVFMSVKVMNTKVNGLMSIMNKQKHHVVTLVVKLPGLLRCNLDSVRHAFGGLQELLQKREGFVYAMVCHAPALLLLTPRGLHQRCTALQRCLAASPDWCEQFTQLRPPGVAQLVLNRHGSLSVMMYLTQRQRAGAAPLGSLLSHGPDGGPAKALGEGWPDFQEWMERRRQYITLRMRQHRAGMRAAAECVAWMPPGLRQGPVNWHVPELYSSSSHQQQQQQFPLTLPGQQHGASTVTASVTSGMAPGGATAMGVHAHLQTNQVLHHMQQELDSTCPHATLQPQLAGISLEPIMDFHGGNGNSCRSSFSSRDDECTRESINRQDSDGHVAVKGRQQPGASTSGRQPSWMQLQAEYRRSLPSKAHRKAARALQRLDRPGGQAALGLGRLPPRRRLRMQYGAPLKRFNLRTHTAVEAGPMGSAETEQFLCRAARQDSLEHASLQPIQCAAGGPPASELRSPRVQQGDSQWTGPLVSASGCTIRVSELQSLVGAEDSSSSSTLLPAEPLHVASTPLGDDGLGHFKDFASCHPIGSVRDDHEHVLRGLLLSGRGQQAGVVLSLGTGSSSPEAVDATHEWEGEVVAALPTAFRGSQLPPSITTCRPRVPRDTAAAGETTTTEGDGTSSGWPLRTANKGVGPNHGVDSDARKVPLWLHLDSSGIRSSPSDQAEALERVHQTESEAHIGRRGAAPPAEAPQHGEADKMVVVSGDGSVCDINGLGRDLHAPGPRGQEAGAGLGIGHTQMLESAVEATVPR